MRIKHLFIPDTEIVMTAVRSQGAGGQNVNKVSSAIHLRFDIKNSSLPKLYKNRLLSMRDNRLTRDGHIIIKAQNHRSQEQNREEAIQRLVHLIRQAIIPRKKRKPTRPSSAARKRRVDNKTQRARLKNLRKKITE